VAVKIRLKRIGKKRTPHYRIVVMDARAKRDGRAIEEIGIYNPKTEPSFIRVESDETTYNLHILLRFEMEQAMLGNDLSVDDVPAAWNERMKKYLGLTPPDDAKGCLQDVHWSHGSFGYFPTYSLGSFYAAQFYAFANQAIPDLNDHIRKGNTTSLLQWLRNQVHNKGRRFTSEQLCQEICGETLNIEYFISYLLDKYKDIYKF